MKAAFVYTDRYFDYNYGEHHPLKIEDKVIAILGRQSGSPSWGFKEAADD